jgi:molybdate transport system substrate-binding protein
MRFAALTVSTCLTLLTAVVAQAANITVLATGSATPAAKALAERFTQETGTTVTFGGLRPADVVASIKAGGAADVLVMPGRTFASISAFLVPGSVVPVARIAIGVAVPPGAPVPDISTPEKFRAVLLAAPKGVAYSDPAIGSSAGPVIEAILKEPAYAGVKLKPVKALAVTALASGEADIALQMITELKTTKDIQLVGPIPDGVGAFVDVSVGITKTAPPEAQAYVRYIVRPEAASAWEAAGATLIKE